MPPRAILSDRLEECIKGRRVVAAIFLTFEFDPGFFEQEVLPVLLDLPVSHAKGIRLVQLEDALRDCAGNIAVYYDADRLVEGSSGSAHLDVRRIPVRHGTGVFHPKNILLLLEDRVADDTGHHAQALLVGALSANLTRTGWWENVEACHFEEIPEYGATRLTDDLQRLLRLLRSRTGSAGSNPSLELILDFLSDTEKRKQRTSNQALFTHFFAGGASFSDFLENCAGNALRECTYLEIISPYLGDGPTSPPLIELLQRFGPKETRILLPRDRDGVVPCSPELHKSISELEGVSWGKLPSEVTANGGSQNSPPRFVHAKVYRFFCQKPKREICFVGSVNLTVPAHSRGGNWETGLLVDVECLRAPEFWLEADRTKPANYKSDDECDPAKSGGTPLVVRYHWDQGKAEYQWETDVVSPPKLRLEMRGVTLCELGPIRARTWLPFDPGTTTQLAEFLKETSFIKVIGPGERSGLLLVQEEGMAHKPSLLHNLSTAEILRYWSLLTADQRIAFIEAKASELKLDPEGAELLSRTKINWGDQTFFDRFAGIFHAFSCLENAVREKLSAKPPRTADADYRLFGKKYDSLGTLLTRVMADPAITDDIERYILILCAKQTTQELRREFPDYWQSRKQQAQELEVTLEQSQTIRSRLASTGQHADMPAFLDWFDTWFLKRAKSEEDNS